MGKGLGRETIVVLLKGKLKSESQQGLAGQHEGGAVASPPFIRPLSLFLFQTSVLDLKEKASSLASSTVKKDSRLKSLEINLEQKREECVKLENQLKKVGAHDLQR